MKMDVLLIRELFGQSFVNNFETLKYVYEKGGILDEKVFIKAIEYGYINILEWLYKKQ